MSPEQEEQIRAFVKGKLQEADIAHGFDHIEYVVNMARKIALREGANLRIVIPAAYLHDVVSRGEVDSFHLHTDESAAVGKQFLEGLGFSPAEVQEIGNVIATSSYESYLKGVEPASLEAKVVRDADWLDSIGARGIARVFAFAGHYGCPEMGKVDRDPDNPEKLEMNILLIRKCLVSVSGMTILRKLSASFWLRLASKTNVRCNFLRCCECFGFYRLDAFRV